MRILQRLFNLIGNLIKGKPKTSIPLHLAYTDNTGRRWYTYLNFVDIPVQRMVYIQLAARDAEMKVTPLIFGQYLEKMTKAVNEGKINVVMEVINELKTRQTLFAEEDTLIRLMAHYVVMDGEDPATHSDSLYLEKIDRFKKDISLKNFFLEFVGRRMISLPDGWAGNMIDYLAKTRFLVQKMNQSLPKQS